ncbi:hypothetical protein MMC25_007367 [Agyrium rufum]|nr:hypothetical protein [Agyrium rufum]
MNPALKPLDSSVHSELSIANQEHLDGSAVNVAAINGPTGKTSPGMIEDRCSSVAVTQMLQHRAQQSCNDPKPPSPLQSPVNRPSGLALSERMQISPTPELGKQILRNTILDVDSCVSSNEKTIACMQQTPDAAGSQVHCPSNDMPKMSINMPAHESLAWSCKNKTAVGHTANHINASMKFGEAALTEFSDHLTKTKSSLDLLATSICEAKTDCATITDTKGKGRRSNSVTSIESAMGVGVIPEKRKSKRERQPRDLPDRFDFSRQDDQTRQLNVDCFGDDGSLLPPAANPASNRRRTQRRPAESRPFRPLYIKQIDAFEKILSRYQQAALDAVDLAHHEVHDAMVFARWELGLVLGICDSAEFDKHVEISNQS